ncbi:MAG: hypothetical protein ABJA78_17305 [Ferruginibacter sp.]
MKHFLVSVIAIGYLSLTQTIIAQNIGIGTTTPDASAQLEINSSAKGILIPRVALSASNITAPILSPSNSLLIYNTASAGTAPNDVSPGYYFWDSTSGSWVKMISANESVWYSTATGTASTNFADNIFHTQRVSIGGPGTTTYNARLQVDIGSVYNLGFLVTGDNNAAAVVPNIGAGSRLMFYPGKSIFRSGLVSGTQWDDANAGTYSVAMGYNDIASSLGSVSFGIRNASTGISAVSMGDSCAAIGRNSFAAGFLDSAVDDHCIAMGNAAYAAGQTSTAIGASGYNDGTNTSVTLSRATGNYSNALAGGHSTARGAFSAGYLAVASGENSTAIGFFSNAPGNYSFANSYSTASGISSTALGGAIVTGQGAFGEGNGAVATGNYSSALGPSTASGTYSFAGTGSYATGTSSTALAGGSANAMYSTAIGALTGSFGNSAIAIGYQATARSDASLSAGYGTYSRAYGSTSLGIFNDSLSGSLTSIIATDPLLIIGNGTANNSRSNALVMLKNGNTGIGVNNPGTNKLEVNGNTQTDSLQVSNGNKFSKIQSGSILVGSSGTVIKTVIVTYPTSFIVPPRIVCTVINDDPLQPNVNDTWAVSVRAITNAQFSVNVVRVDSNAGWSSAPHLSWIAFAN